MRDLDSVGESHSPSSLPAVTDVNPSFSSESHTPIREGLPASYRMRADAHYVDQLGASPGTAVQMLPIDMIDAEDASSAPVELVESVRHFGVLEPLLVQKRDRRYRVVTGRRRLAAARAAGAREVPCAVRRLTDAELSALKAPLGTKPVSTVEPTATGAAAADVLRARELAIRLSSVLSCADLVADGVPALTRRVAVDMIRAEVQRVICALRTSAALQGDTGDARRPLSPRSLVDQLLAAIAAETRLRGTVVSTRVEARDDARVLVDESAVVSALAGVVLMLSAGLHDVQAARLRISAVCEPGKTLVVTIAHEGVILPTATITMANGPEDGELDAPLAALIALRMVSETHGGALSVGRLPRGTEVSVTLPLDEFAF